MFWKKKKKINDEKLIGKIILVGMTYYNKNNEFVEQKQFWGTIISINGNNIVIKQKNGEEFTIPNDKRAIEPANPGEYRLRSTGEVVENPDFLSTWNVTLPN
jgi:hypothetical protein